jgi:predicted transcriptional regulator
MPKATARRGSTTAGTAKTKVLAAVAKLPANATIEDAIESLIFPAKIDHGLAEIDSGRGINHSEAQSRLIR